MSGIQTKQRRAARWLLAAVAMLLPGLSPALAEPGPSMFDPAGNAAGAKVYAEVCTACHETGVERAPPRIALQQLTPEAIHRALTEGLMREQAAGLSAPDKVAVAEYLGGQKLGGAAVAPANQCRGAAARFDASEPPVLPGWGYEPGNSHALSSKAAGIGKADLGRIRLKWAFAFPGATRARAQPSLAGGAIHLGSQTGTVYALDRASGCVRWTFDASAEVRTGILFTPWRRGDAKARPLALFGDSVSNVYALDARSGALVWKVRTDAHPLARITGTPALHEGTLYVPVSSLEEAAAANPAYGCCTFRGSILALDARTGKEKWRTWLVEPASPQGSTPAGADRFGPSGVPVWNAPAIDVKRGLLYVGTGNNYSHPTTQNSNSIVAVELASGKIRWRYQATPGDAWNVGCAFRTPGGNCPDDEGPDFDFGAGVVLAKDAKGHARVLAGQKSGIAWAIDPDTGKLVWQTRIGRGGAGGGIHFGIAAANGLLYAPVTDIDDGKPSDFPLSPGLYALDLTSGARVWSAAAPTNTCTGRAFCRPGLGGAITATPELVFAGADDSHLRAHDAKSGAVLWDFDTAREFATVNGLPGRGGAMAGGAAPVAWQGELFVSSGHAFAGKTPGNVLLVFTTK